MIFFLRLMFVFLLGACAVTGMNREAFLGGFTPTAQHILQFDSANHALYKPRVSARGLEAINTAVNALPFVPDACEQHPIDPTKFWKHGGDCEEYALIKMLELRAQGINDTYFLVLADRTGGRNHAVLVAEDRGQLVALDNKTDAIHPLTQLYARYRPLYVIEAATGRVLKAKP